MAKSPTPSAEPMATPDDAAVSRAQASLAANGVRVDADVVREALTAAETPEPDKIPVSDGMFRAGLKVWLDQPAASPHVLLPAIYRAMEQQRRDEDAAIP